LRYDDVRSANAPEQVLLEFCQFALLNEIEKPSIIRQRFTAVSLEKGTMRFR
jgi:putative NADH-flavin reductase